MIGGAIAIYDRTRAIDSGINALIVKTKGNYQALYYYGCFLFWYVVILGLRPMPLLRLSL